MLSFSVSVCLSACLSGVYAEEWRKIISINTLFFHQSTQRSWCLVTCVSTLLMGPVNSSVSFTWGNFGVLPTSLCMRLAGRSCIGSLWILLLFLFVFCYPSTFFPPPLLLFLLRFVVVNIIFGGIASYQPVATLSLATSDSAAEGAC